MMDAMHEARKAWWNSTCRRGDPARMPNLAFEAFEAGWNTRPLTGGVTEEMVEAGWEAFNQHDDYRTAMREAYLAMSNVSRGVK